MRRVKIVATPPFTIRTKEEEKAHQKELGKFLGFYYGDDMYECCGVFPKFCTTRGFESECYYICEVCGSRTGNCSMEWLAKEEWQHEHRPYIQMTVFDILEGGN